MLGEYTSRNGEKCIGNGIPPVGRGKSRVKNSTVNHNASQGECPSDQTAFSIMCWNIDGLHSKIRDDECIGYIGKFDIAALVETFVEGSYNVTLSFPDHDTYLCSAVKLSHQGRRSGGVMLLVKKCLAKFVEKIDTIFDQLIVLKLSKTLFKGTYDVMLIAAYVPPQGSKYYATAETNCHLETLDNCILYLMETYKDFHLMLIGDMNARTARFQVSLEEDSLLPFTDPLSPNSFLCNSRKSQDPVINDFGHTLLDLCLCFDLHIHNGEVVGDEEGRYTYISEHGNSVIDYCITSLDFVDRVRSVSVAQRIESTHMPIETVLSLEQSMLPDEQSFAFDKYVWQPDKADEFARQIFSDDSVRAIRDACNMTDVDVNRAVEIFCKCLLDAGSCMKKTIRSKPRSQRSQWFDRQCVDSKEDTCKALRKYRSTKSDRDKQEYLSQRKTYKSLLKDKESAFKAERVQKLQENLNDSVSFWKEMRHCKRTPTMHGNIPKDAWFTHFSDLLNFDVNTEDAAEYLDLPVDVPFDALLDSDISEGEVKIALRKLKCGKAAGPDQIINEFLKYAEPLILPFLVRMFNKVFSSGIYPEEWTKSIIIPLHKKGDRDNPDNYRGISLLSCVSKVFTSVLNARLMRWAETNSVITDAQAGFRRKHSTIDHIFALYACIEKQFARNAKLYVAFVDFYKAFDVICHSTLWMVLSRTGVQGRMLAVLRGMYNSIKSCVRCTGSELTDYFECLQGLKQGCLCSPILFSYFINELANDIIRGGRNGIQLLPNQVELFLMLFADDLALMSSTVIGLQNQLNLLYEASRRLGLKVNTDKTKIVVFRKGGYLGAREKWYLGDRKLEVVGKYKYLGLNFSTMLSFNIATGEFVARAKKGVVEIVRALKAYGCFSCEVFFKLFDAQIAPSLLYASELWGFKENKQIEKVHLYACKLFVNLPVRTPNDMVYGELGRYPLAISSAARCIQYWFRLLKQEDTRYSKMAYLSLLGMHDRGKTNWVSHVKSLLCDCGFGLVWLFGGVSDEKQFLREFKDRLRSNFSLRWLTHLQDSPRYEMYHAFKDVVGRELYLDTIKVTIYRTALARFRLGVSPFNAHRHRYSLSVDSRMCPFCPEQIEDEVHVVFECSSYTDIRRRYIPQLNDDVNKHDLILSTLKCNTEGEMISLAKFLYLAWQIRLNQMNQQ